MKVAVKPAVLRELAGELGALNDPYHRPEVDVRRLGAPPAVWAFEGFEGHWGPGQRALTAAVEELRAILAGAADGYELRDARSAASFRGGPRVF
ncbi:hypothetical protein [Leifsonia sp. NPDC077715]|uniref:WXG100 family type VII secretion target n=1 Tax=Leifsonia sp. NPDC077715 TaxID=3155539 RepID=UPI0034395611